MIVIDADGRIVQQTHQLNILSAELFGPLGSPNQVLATNGAGTGLEWATVGGGGGTVTGSGAANRLALWDSATNLTSDALITWGPGGFGPAYIGVGDNIWTEAGISIAPTFPTPTGLTSATLLFVTSFGMTGSPIVTQEMPYAAFQFSASPLQYVHNFVPSTSRAFYIDAPEYSNNTGSDTITNAATFSVTGAPTASAGITITNSYSVWVQSGMSQLDGGWAVGSTVVYDPAVGILSIGDNVIPGGFSAGVQVHKTGAAAGLTAITYSNTASQGSFMTGARARGTLGAEAAIQSGDILFRFNSIGYYTSGGPSWTNVNARMEFIATEAYTSAAWGSKIVLSVTPAGSTTPAVGMTLDSVGAVFTGTLAASNLSGTNTGDESHVKEIPTGLVNGTNTTFTLSGVPAANSLKLFMNGLFQGEGIGKDYTLSGSTISMLVTPQTGDILWASYST